MAEVERPGAQEWVPERGGVSALREAVHGCRGCELWAPATQAVFSSGPARARLMLVGEQPGDQEDKAGEPFVGPAGRVLRDALETAGVGIGEVYLTNAVKHFRFEERGKRRLHKNPEVAHITACRPWLDAELAAVRPEVVVALGATAGRAVFHRTVRIGAERGTITETPEGVRALLTAHPSAVLRLRGKPEWDDAFGQLAADLATAAGALD